MASSISLGQNLELIFFTLKAENTLVYFNTFRIFFSLVSKVNGRSYEFFNSIKIMDTKWYSYKQWLSVQICWLMMYNKVLIQLLKKQYIAETKQTDNVLSEISIVPFWQKNFYDSYKKYTFFKVHYSSSHWTWCYIG